MSIKGFKVFNSDWTCRDFQYKVGKIFEHKGNIEMCGAGFHFCRKASNCFNYYDFNKNNKVAEIEALGLVETQGDKSVTNKIKIIREIEWKELLDIVNEGTDCTGLGNTGDCNTGNWNTGNRNTGDWNTGNRNTGFFNTGNRNTGNCNTGDCNTGNRNTGDWNTGDCNTGNWNTGNRNTGDWNTGDWNTGDWNTGFFNTITPPFYVFNEEYLGNKSDILCNRGVQILNFYYEHSWWVYSQNMTDEEKEKHPEHETTGGYLKTVDFKTACKMMWENLSSEEKKEVTKIPNFDKNIFKKITGIEVNNA